jgi:hypothetical protein
MIYFIQEGAAGPIKIGYTRDHPQTRLYHLQTGNYRLLRIVATMEGGLDLEKALHQTFTRLECGEWFKPTPALLGYIAERALPWAKRPRAHALRCMKRSEK